MIRYIFMSVKIGDHWVPLSPPVVVDAKDLAEAQTKLIKGFTYETGLFPGK